MHQIINSLTNYCKHPQHKAAETAKPWVETCFVGKVAVTSGLGSEIWTYGLLGMLLSIILEIIFQLDTARYYR
jgi:hypothetical protein